MRKFINAIFVTVLVFSSSFVFNAAESSSSFVPDIIKKANSTYEDGELLSIESLKESANLDDNTFKKYISDTGDTFTFDQGNQLTTITNTDEGQRVEIDIEGKENFNKNFRADDVNGGNASGLVSITEHRSYLSETQRGHYIYFAYKYDIYKYKTGSRYYYSIKNISTFNFNGSAGVRWDGRLLEYHNTTTSNKTSYAYIVPTLGGSGNVVVRAYIQAPKNT